LIPRLGGIVFFPSILIAVSLTIAFHNLWTGINMLDADLTSRLLLIFCCMFVLYLTGITDDLIGTRYRSKFAIQIFCGILIVLSGIRLDNFYGLFGIYSLNHYISVPFTVLMIVFIINAINLIDGVDGLAAGLSVIACFFLGSSFILLQCWIYAFISFSILGVLLPFFYYNVFGKRKRKRKIFMGDTGTLSIGLLLSVLIIQLSMSDPVKDKILPNSIVVAFSSLLVPMLDVVRIVILRIRAGQSPFLPDKSHIHHKFIALGFSFRRTMLTILLISFFFSLFNLLVIHYIPLTYLFLLDIAIWTAMHVQLTLMINKEKKIMPNK
jgi:UDP-N-acetylmuramyl pentapeptide phosphotransferase/UDP-N-acetylglucosamine-1-phosphate transferase